MNTRLFAIAFYAKGANQPMRYLLDATGKPALFQSRAVAQSLTVPYATGEVRAYVVRVKP